MKPFKRKSRYLVSGVALAALFGAAASADEQQLAGTWNCNLMFEDPNIGATMTGQFEQTYKQDGSYERAGQMRIVVAAFDVDAAFTVAEAGDWRSDGVVITEMRSKLEFATVDPDPSPAAQLVVQQMQAEANAETVAEESVEITKLTATQLEFEDPDGAAAVCRKA